MEINLDILNKILPNKSDDLLSFEYKIEDNEGKKKLTVHLNEFINISIEFEKQIILEVLMEIPVWATISRKYCTNERALIINERELIIKNEEIIVKEFALKHKDIFPSFSISGGMDDRSYHFMYLPGCSYVLWQNEKIIDIKTYIFQYLKLKAA